MVKDYIVLSVIFLTLLLTGGYAVTRIILFILSDYNWIDSTLGFGLLFSELFILVHSMGYFGNILHGLLAAPSNYSIQQELLRGELQDLPPTAIVVASYKEPICVLRDTLICFYNLNYGNKQLYLLDDTRYDQEWASMSVREAYRQSIDHMCRYLGINVFRREWHHAKAGIINDFIVCISGKKLPKFELQMNRPTDQEPKYLIVFDADMNPIPDFVEPLVQLMESQPELAFVQTPQYYSNFENNRVARASGLIQAVFYEYICEAKGAENSMFCCGTNFIMRLSALRQVGGFDQTSITEDFATSLAFHMTGWQSRYFNYVCAFGMGPEDLEAFFKQQYRWAVGTLSMLKRLIKEFFHKPSALKTIAWWQYFLSSTYYFVGIVFLILWMCPVIYLFFNVPSFFANHEIYLAIFLPYLLFSNLVFYWTLRTRDYHLKELILGLVLIAFSYPIYVKAALSVISGRGSLHFTVTPKGKSAALPLKDLWAQVATALILFSAMVWGLCRIYYEEKHYYSITFNIFWSFYYFCLITSVFYFNDPIELEIPPNAGELEKGKT